MIVDWFYDAAVSGADPIEARPDSLVAWRIAGAVLPDFHLVENRVLG